MSVLADEIVRAKMRLFRAEHEAVLGDKKPSAIIYLTSRRASLIS